MPAFGNSTAMTRRSFIMTIKSVVLTWYMPHKARQVVRQVDIGGMGHSVILQHHQQSSLTNYRLAYSNRACDGEPAQATPANIAAMLYLGQRATQEGLQLLLACGAAMQW